LLLLLFGARQCHGHHANWLGLASIVDVTTATTALLLSEVRLSEARYIVQIGIAAVAFATGIGYQQF